MYIVLVMRETELTDSAFIRNTPRLVFRLAIVVLLESLPLHQGGAALWVYFGLARVVAALQFSRLENERG